jgi:5-methylcytosine-specific restriction endonuclease McrA
MDLSRCSDENLLSSVAELVGTHRVVTAKLVAHLAEIEDRRLQLVAGYSSMFDFCQKKLGMSESEAFRRILAARLARRFPAVVSLLASGDTNLSTLELLRERLTEENHGELFAAVSRKSKHEVQMLLAARFPRPNRPSTIRRLSSIEPLSERGFKVEFTASDALRRKLELCRDLMSHANPSRDLAMVVERAMDLLLADLERKRLGRTKRPYRKTPARGVVSGRPTSGATTSDRARSGRVTNAVRREVYERDGFCCTYLGEDGHQCEARAFLELDHVEAKAVGGSSGADNLRVRCRSHNQLTAEQTFGREHVEQCRHFRQRKSISPRCAAKNHRTQEAVTTANLEKVRSALRNMGFRDLQARQAIAKVALTEPRSEVPTLERTLREAILAATRA